MADHFCHNKCDDLALLAKNQKKVLWIVLLINAAMFFIEYLYGLLSHSKALMADSLDMLADALAYSTSLYVLSMSIKAKVRASQFKALLMIVLGFSVLTKAIMSFVSYTVPMAETMTIIGGLALAANSYCLYLLSKHKNDDINFTSVWICSRNDIIANVAVLISAGLVFYFNSPYPDLLVALGITFLFLRSAIGILRESFRAEKI